MNAVAEAPIATTTAMPLRRKPNLRPAQRIVLTGFMGSGKSTVGRLLAASLGWEFLDLDTVIEERNGSTVPQIFAERGEAAFRREETAALVSVLGRSRVVIALGGGAPETLGNRLLLEQTPATAIIYLEAGFRTLADRCSLQALDPDATARPNFLDPALAEQRFRMRHPIYARLASHRVETTDLQPEEVANKVLETLQLAAR